MSAAIYTRCPHPVNDDSHTLQATRCQVVARQAGIAVGEHYVDTGMSRGDFLRLLDAVQADEVDTVLVDRTSRFPTGGLDRLAQLGVRVVSESVDTGVPATRRFDEQVRQVVDGVLPL